MTSQFTDPPDHVRPYQFSTLTSGASLLPEGRRFFLGLITATAVLGALFVSVSVGIVSSFSSWMIPAFGALVVVLWVAVWLMFIKSHEWYDNRHFPEPFHLAHTKTGLDLLQAGDRLGLRRKRLTDDGESDHPLVPPDDQLAAWEEQWRLERELHAEQEASLRILTAIDNLIG